MTGILKQVLTEHTAHEWEPVDTSHIENVPNLQTHKLMQCPCGWRGWVHNDAWEKQGVTPPWDMVKK